MIEPREYKILQAECPLCGKVLKGISEKHWRNGFKVHLRLHKRHRLPWEEIQQIMQTVKPTFRTVIKTRYHMK
jgi:hypothetical protein